MEKQNYLLHVCCGPCSVAILKELQEKYDLTVYYYNPNIHPEEEYQKRKKEVVKLCEEMSVPFVEAKYEPEEWRKTVKGLEKEPEGGKRCTLCFQMRLNKTLEFADKEGFMVIGTSLTSGRNKKAEVINFIGKQVGNSKKIEFHEEDWKKKGRQEKANALIKEKGIYRQDYCGCVFSIKK